MATDMHTTSTCEKIEILLPDIHQRILEAYYAGDVDRLPPLFSTYRASGFTVGEQFSDNLGDAIMDGNEKMAAYLVGEGVPINGMTVQRAANAGSTQALRLILQLGWDINRPCGTMKGPALSHAVQYPDLVEWLLRKGADPNARCDVEYTPLSAAAETGTIAVFDAMIDHGGNPEQGQLAHYAAQRTDPQLEQMLSRLSEVGAPLNDIMYANVKAKTTTERNLEMMPLATPLHHAVAGGNYRATKALLELGASSKERKGDLKRPQDLTRGDQRMMEILTSRRETSKA